MSKLLCFLLVLGASFGCDVGSKKDSKSKSTFGLGTDDQLDSDGDGITDTTELKFGSNVFIPDMPIIQTINAKDIQIISKYIDKDSDDVFKLSMDYKRNAKSNIQQLGREGLFSHITNDIVRTKSLNATFSSVYTNEINVDALPEFEDFLYSKVGCLDDSDLFRLRSRYKQFSDQYSYLKTDIKFKYQYQFQNLDGLSNIRGITSNAVVIDKYMDTDFSRVKLRNYQDQFNFNNQNVLNYKKLFQSNTVTKENLGFSELNLNSGCLYHQVEDFSFTRFGKTISYQDIRSTIESTNSHIVVTTPYQTFWVSIVPGQYRSVLTALKKLGLEPSVDNKFVIQSLSGLDSTITLRDVILEPNPASMNDYRWYFLTTSLKDINSSLEEGAVYLFNYASGIEMLKHSNNIEKLAEEKIINTDLNLESYDLKIGDRLVIEANIQSKLNVSSSSKGVIRGESRCCTQRGSMGGDRHKSSQVCEEWGWCRDNRACRFSETVTDPDLGAWAEGLFAETLAGEIDLYFGNRKIEAINLGDGKSGFLINIVAEDLTGRSPSLRLTNISTKKFNYSRTRNETGNGRDHRCFGGDRTFSVTKDVKKEFRYKLNISREGIIR